MELNYVNGNEKVNEFKTASPIMRIWSRLIDDLVIFLVSLPLVFSAILAKGSVENFVVNGIISLIFEFIIPVITRGKTIGKAILGLRIVKLNGKKASVFILFMRSLIYTGYCFVEIIPNSFQIIIDVTGVFFILSFILIFFDKRNQALHDILTGTMVVKER